MHQYGQHLQQQDPFVRRAIQEQLSFNNPRANNLASSPQTTNPWLQSYQNQQNIMSPNYNNMSIPDMFHSRWEQEQATLLHQREMQLQRNEQVQMMYRERHLQEEMQKREEQLQREKQVQLQQEQQAQMERDREAQLQREREIQIQREREIQIQREREAQLQRERELQIQREQEAQHQKEIEAKMQRERDRQAQMQKERELQLQKEHEAQQLQLQREYMKGQEMRQAFAMRERERKAIYYRDPFFQQQEQQPQSQQQQQHQQQQHQQPSHPPSHPPPQYPNFFSPTQNSISNLNYSQSNNQIQQQMTFFNQPNINSTTTGSSSSLNFSMDQIFNPNKVSESPSSSTKVVSSNTSFNFPSPSAVIVSSENSTTNSLRKSSSNSFDNGFINSIVSDKGFLDLENVDLNEIENNLGVKEKDSSNIQSSDIDPFPASDIGILNGKHSKDLDDPSFSAVNSLNSLPDNLVDFDKFPMESKLTTKNNISSEEQDFSSVLSSISYSALHNSNSKILANDNGMMVDDAQKPTESTKQDTTFTISSTTTKPLFSTNNHISSIKHDNTELKTEEEEDSSHQKLSIPEPMTTRSKPKQSFSSIESFLGMSDDSKTDVGNADEPLDKVQSCLLYTSPSPRDS